MNWTPDILTPLREALLAHLFDGADAPAFTVYDADDRLLATLPLHSGTVDPLTGILTLTPSTLESSAPATGEAAYAHLHSAAGVLYAAHLPVSEGDTATPGHVVLSHRQIAQGGQVSLISAQIG